MKIDEDAWRHGVIEDIKELNLAIHEVRLQLSDEIGSLTERLLDYICTKPEPHPNPQWVEERIRALESQVKQLKQALPICASKEDKVGPL